MAMRRMAACDTIARDMSPATKEILMVMFCCCGLDMKIDRERGVWMTKKGKWRRTPPFYIILHTSPRVDDEEWYKVHMLIFLNFRKQLPFLIALTLSIMASAW